MSGSDELRNLLDRLKEEVGPLPEPPQRREPARSQEPPRPRPAPADLPPPRRADPLARPYRADLPRDLGQGRAQPNLAWSENKETILFGMLAALLAAFGGILAGLDFMVLIGGVVFMLFAFMMLLTLFGTYLSLRRPAPDRGLAEKVEALSRKVDSLSSSAAQGGAPYAPLQEREHELEHKVEELRVMVRTLSRAVSQQDDKNP